MNADRLKKTKLNQEVFRWVESQPDLRSVWEDISPDWLILFAGAIGASGKFITEVAMDCGKKAAAVGPECFFNKKEWETSAQAIAKQSITCGLAVHNIQEVINSPPDSTKNYYVAFDIGYAYGAAYDAAVYAAAAAAAFIYYSDPYAADKDGAITIDEIVRGRIPFEVIEDLWDRLGKSGETV